MSPFGAWTVMPFLSLARQSEPDESRRNNPRPRKSSGKDRSKVKKARKQKHRSRK